MHLDVYNLLYATFDYLVDLPIRNTHCKFWDDLPIKNTHVYKNIHVTLVHRDINTYILAQHLTHTLHLGPLSHQTPTRDLVQGTCLQVIPQELRQQR